VALELTISNPLSSKPSIPSTISSKMYAQKQLLIALTLSYLL